MWEKASFALEQQHHFLATPEQVLQDQCWRCGVCS